METFCWDTVTWQLPSALCKDSIGRFSKLPGRCNSLFCLLFLHCLMVAVLWMYSFLVSSSFSGVSQLSFTISKRPITFSWDLKGNIYQEEFSLQTALLRWLPASHSFTLVPGSSRWFADFPLIFLCVLDSTMLDCKWPTWVILTATGNINPAQGKLSKWFSSGCCSALQPAQCRGVNFSKGQDPIHADAQMPHPGLSLPLTFPGFKQIVSGCW